MEERILSYCNQTFMRYGVRSVSMDEIAVGIGVSKKTLYQFFQNKEDIVHAIMQQALQEDNIILERLPAESNNPLEALFRIMVYHTQKVEQMNPVLLYDVRKYYPNVWQLLERYRFDVTLHTVAENLAQGVAAGLYRSDLDVTIVSRLFLTLNDAMINVEPHLTPAATHHQMMFLFLYGVTTPRGHELVDHYRKTLIKKNIPS